MKRYLLWLPVVLIITSATVYKHEKKKAELERAVSKSISFAVYKGNSYSSKIYNNTSVQLHITIEKVQGENRTVVWNKTYDEKLLKKFPDIEHACLHQVTIPGVIEKKEHLKVTYTLTYKSNGSELQMQSEIPVLAGANDSKLNISI